jgi:phosphoribosylaminoimidazole (AIR) synthetase
VKQEQFIWKGAAVQRGLEPERRGLATVRCCCQETTSEDTAGWERLSMCVNDL